MPGRPVVASAVASAVAGAAGMVPGGLRTADCTRQKLVARLARMASIKYSSTVKKGNAKVGQL